MDEAKIVNMSDEQLKAFALGLVERSQSLKNLRTEDSKIEDFNIYDRATYREPLQNLTMKIKLVRREFKNRDIVDEIIARGILE